MAFENVTVYLVAALSQNNVIGANNAIPWHIKEDLRHFKELTLHKVIIMGRKTLDSIARPLPHREMVVISRQSNFTSNLATTCSSLSEALLHAKQHCLQNNLPLEAYIIGGEQIYRQALDEGVVDFMHLTIIEKDFEGDAFFPNYDKTQWKVISRVPGQQDGLKYQFLIKRRRFCG